MRKNLYQLCVDESGRIVRKLKAGAALALLATACCASSGISIPAGTNLGRQTLFVSGINGVTPGGQVQVNFPCDRRYHRIIYYQTAINYTGGVAAKVTGLTSGANTATAIIAVSTSHVPTTVDTIAGVITGYTNGESCTIVDSTGAGALFTATVAGGNLTALTYQAGTATPTAMSAANFYTQLVQTVGGVNVRDLTPAQEILRAQINPDFGVPGTITAGTRLPALGQFPIFYTEPWRNFTRWPAITAWDMAGQSSFQHKLTLSPNLVTPGLVAVMEFDFMRNTISGEIPQSVYGNGSGMPALMLTPITAHAFTVALGAGLNLINILPSNFPVTRLLLTGSISGQITQVEVDKDGAKIFESYAGTAANAQLNELWNEYQFDTNYFDAMVIFDVNQRVNQALKFLQPQGGLILRVWSAQAQNLTVIQEKLPGGYAS